MTLPPVDVPPVNVIADAADSDIAAWLAERLRSALAAPGRVAVTIPGGSTPFPILGELVNDRSIEWGRLVFWPGDDRLVPEDHPASNVGRMRKLLEPAGATVTALADTAVPPRFALAWLGMGEDGHIASLFPSSDPRADDARAVRRITPDPLPPEAPFDRVSLTIPALLNSAELLLVMRGAAKRALFEAALRGENDLPVARLLAARRQPVTVFG